MVFWYRDGKLVSSQLVPSVSTTSAAEAEDTAPKPLAPSQGSRFNVRTQLPDLWWSEASVSTLVEVLEQQLFAQWRRC